jgi:hypothetical protein
MSQKSGEALQEKHSVTRTVYYYNVSENKSGKKQNGADQCVKKKNNYHKKISSKQIVNTSKCTTKKHSRHLLRKTC